MKIFLAVAVGAKDRSQLARQGALRNAAIEFQGMSLSQDDVNELAAFLASLTEDYDDA